MVRAIEVIAKRNWREAAALLECQETPVAIGDKLIKLFPAIAHGRKNQDNLIQELALGECSLSIHEGEIVRVVNLAKIDVFDSDLVLFEVYQELENGERFFRNIQGVAEKIQYPESHEEGARRGLLEELGVYPATLTYNGEAFDKNQRSKYEGIESYALSHKFVATLHPKDVKEEYVEIRDGVTTVFRWL